VTVHDLHVDTGGESDQQQQQQSRVS
jgi:hypothetical protein